MQEIIEKLASQVSDCEKLNQDLDDCSWGEEEGVLLSANEARKIIDYLKRATWQPIETAPRDGQEVLLLISEYSHPVAGCYYHGERWRAYEFALSFHESKIIGWMPLPESPVFYG